MKKLFAVILVCVSFAVGGSAGYYFGRERLAGQYQGFLMLTSVDVLKSNLEAGKQLHEGKTQVVMDTLDRAVESQRKLVEELLPLTTLEIRPWAEEVLRSVADYQKQWPPKPEDPYAAQARDEILKKLEGVQRRK